MTVTCPKCLCEARVALDVTDGDTLRCPECEEEYAVADVEAVVASWARLLPWIRSHPARADRPEGVPPRYAPRPDPAVARIADAVRRADAG